MKLVSFGTAVLLGATLTSAFAGTPDPAARVAARSRGQAVATSRPEATTLKPVERTGLLRTSAGLSRVQLANGATMVDLQGRYREFVVVGVDAHGQTRVGCVHDPRALLRVLAGEAQAIPMRFEDR